MSNVCPCPITTQTINTLCQSMSHAIHVCQQDITTPNKSIIIQNITQNFLVIISQVTSYNNTQLPNTYSYMPENNAHSTHSVDKAVQQAKSIPINNEKVFGGVAFKHPNEIDMDVSINSSSEESSTESSVDVEAMAPGQRENYFKTKKLAQGLRKARESDDLFTSFQGNFNVFEKQLDNNNTNNNNI